MRPLHPSSEGMGKKSGMGGTVRGLVFLTGLMALTSGCATTLNSEQQLVLISSKPQGAKVTVDDRLFLTTPGRVNLHRLGDHMIFVEMEGYEPEMITTERVMSKLVFLDALCIPFWWYCIDRDLRDGGWYSFQDEYHVKLTKRPGAEDSEESLQSGEPAPSPPISSPEPPPPPPKE